MSSLLNLPDDPLLHILSFLDCKDLCSCCCTCHRLHDLGTVDYLWRRHCQFYWLVKSCPEGIGWYELFWNWYKDWGQYAAVYRKIRKAWDQIEAFLQVHSPEVSLTRGVTEDFLEKAELKLGHSLPSDFRCSLRIHDGQCTFPGSPGLFGMRPDFHSYVVDEFLVSFREAMDCRDPDDTEPGAVLLTMVGLTFKLDGHFLALTDEFGMDRGQVYYPLLRDGKDNEDDYSDNNSDSVEHRICDSFISANSFMEFLCNHAQNLEDKRYHISPEGTVHRFYQEPSCVAYTGYISVRVATCFLPDASSVYPDTSFHYAYRITMAMSAIAPDSESCVLETRHWTITDADGNEQKVEGPGVVGTYPQMTPGEEYSWESSTSFKTSYGTMHGYFTMFKFDDGTTFHVECPMFHLKCLPYITHEEKEAKLKHMKKTN